MGRGGRMKARVIKEWEMYGTTHKVGEIMDIPLHSPGGLPMISDRDAFLLDNGFIEEIKEPLIKDEKIRKAVRAWAEANNIKAVYYSPEEDGFYVKNFDDEIVASIYFGDKPMEEDGYGEHYIIDELCGEEEE